MTENPVSDALHDWEDTLAKINAAREALYDFLHGLDKETGVQAAYCIAYTLELVGVEGRRASDIVNKTVKEKAT